MPSAAWQGSKAGPFQKPGAFEKWACLGIAEKNFLILSFEPARRQASILALSLSIVASAFRFSLFAQADFH
jgi:hypothetical protein